MRSKSVAHECRFHTNSLLVNKEICSEASEQLFRSNRFVLVSSQWPGLSDIIHLYDVSIVTEDQKVVATFQHHSLRLHLRHRDVPPKSTSCKAQNFLMLLRDLPEFCRAIRWVSLGAPAKGTIILKQPDTPSDQFQRFSNATAKKTYYTMVKLRSTLYVPLSQEVEASLLKVVQDLRIPGQKVVFDGLLISEASPAFLRSTAGAPIIFITAMAWDMIDVALELMASAKTPTLAGRYKRAAQRYRTIFEPCGESLVFSTPETVYSSDAEAPIVLLGRILMDAAAAYGFLNLRALDVAQAIVASSIAHDLITFMGHFNNRDSVLGYISQPQVEWYMACPAWWVFASSLSTFGCITC